MIYQWTKRRTFTFAIRNYVGRKEVSRTTNLLLGYSKFRNKWITWEFRCWCVRKWIKGSKTASKKVAQRKIRKRYQILKIPSHKIKSHWAWTTEITFEPKASIVGKISDVAVTIKQWWRDVGLCPRPAPTAVGLPASRRNRKGGALRHMGTSFSMCKLNNCKIKRSKYCFFNRNDS